MKMKKLAIIALLITLSVAMVFGLTSCGDDPEEPALQDITGVTFNDASYPYDSEAKTIEISGTLPEGASVTYSPNNSFTEPGVYTVEATVSAEGYNDLVLKATLTITGNQEITTATVKFNSNGGPNLAEGQELVLTVDIGSTVSSPSTPMFRTGYTFSGWYSNGVKWNFSTPVTENITLTAEWDLTQYTVTYHTGVGATNPNTLHTYNFQSETYTLMAPTPADGNAQTFRGWYVLSGSEKVTITAIEKGTTGNLDIYADFAYTDHAITYQLNAVGAVNSANNPTKSNIGSEAYLLYAPTANGYTFIGWYSDASLGDEYAITHIPAAVSAPITVYAKWEKKVYSINYEGLNPTEVPDVATFTADDTVVLPVIADRPGYNFTGWKDSAGNTVTTIPAGTTKNVTVTATWESATYTIEYVLGGGTVPATPNPATYTYTTDTFALSAPTKAHYNFGGWLDDNGNTVTEIARGSYGNIRLTAKWTLVEYTVTYLGLAEVGAVNDAANPATINAENYETTALKSVFVPGYTFDGWYDAETGGNRVTAFTTITNTVLYARFTRNDHSVTYHLDGGINSPDNIHGFNTSDEAFTLLDATKVGYTFVGWFDAEDGGNSVTTVSGDADFVLYARFVLGSEGLTYEDYIDGLMVTGYNGTDTHVVIPATHDGKKVLKIADGAFSGNTVIKTVEISVGITEIGAGAFAGSTLESVVLPASVSAVGAGAFKNSGVTKINCCVQNKPEGYAENWNLADDEGGVNVYIDVVFGYGESIVLPPQPIE